jgi:hypothetical protein
VTRTTTTPVGSSTGVVTRAASRSRTPPAARPVLQATSPAAPAVAPDATEPRERQPAAAAGDEDPGPGQADGTPALGAVLQQLLVAVARLDARVGTMEATGGAEERRTVGQAAAAPLADAAATRQDEMSPVAPTTMGQEAPGGGDEDPDDDGDEAEDSSSSDGGRPRRGSRTTRRGRPSRAPNIKDLELPKCTPSPKVSVSTWIERVDLALEGARSSRRGRWTDQELYYILGNKLLESASKWWVMMNRKLQQRERTWTTLKKALLQRYGERLDMSAAEWRVNQRRMIPGETYADFAAGLRDAAGRNLVEERVLLAQFYRCLSITVRQLVRQRTPATLEEAVDAAMEIDDTNSNVGQGMQNIGQPWATAPNPCLVPMAGTMGQTLVIPGIGGTGFPLDALTTTMGLPPAAGGSGGTSQLALFTNPQGISNTNSGTWEVPPGRSWNGKFWAETAKKERRKRAEKLETTAKRKHGGAAGRERTARILQSREPAASDSDDEPEASAESEEAEAPAPKKARKRKAAVKKAAAAEHGGTEAKDQPPRIASSPYGKPFDNRCFACGQEGHFADRCPDPVAKERNDAYLKQRALDRAAENERRA